jgi:hypothetical protein
VLQGTEPRHAAIEGLGLWTVRAWARGECAMSGDPLLPLLVISCLDAALMLVALVLLTGRPSGRKGFVRHLIRSARSGMQRTGACSGPSATWARPGISRLTVEYLRRAGRAAKSQVPPKST